MVFCLASSPLTCCVIWFIECLQHSPFPPLFLLPLSLTPPSPHFLLTFAIFFPSFLPIPSIFALIFPLLTTFPFLRPFLILSMFLLPSTNMYHSLPCPSSSLYQLSFSIYLFILLPILPSSTLFHFSIFSPPLHPFFPLRFLHLRVSFFSPPFALFLPTILHLSFPSSPPSCFLLRTPLPHTHILSAEPNAAIFRKSRKFYHKKTVIVVAIHETPSPRRLASVYTCTSAPTSFPTPPAAPPPSATLVICREFEGVL